MTSTDTITAAQWRDLRLRAWKYQLRNCPNMERFRVAHRPGKASTN